MCNYDAGGERAGDSPDILQRSLLLIRDIKRILHVQLERKKEKKRESRRQKLQGEQNEQYFWRISFDRIDP